MSSTNGFPFQATRRFVLSKIESQDSEFVISAIRLVDERRGWMASHKSRATKVLAKIAAGSLSPEDIAEATALVMPYARTVSRIMREREMAEHPELLARAAVFGIVRPSAATEATTPVEAASAAVIDTIETEVSAAPLKRRPGRPKGSRNRKPRSEPEQPKRRRRS